MMRIFAGALMAMLSLTSIHAMAQGAVTATEDGVRTALSGYHDAPGAEYWAGLEPESARRVLLNLSSNPDEMIHIRTRATIALSNYPSERVKEYLFERAEKEQRGYVRAAVIRSLSRVAGKEALPVLTKALSDKDGVVKLSAIRSLPEVGGQEAYQALKSGSQAEKDAAAVDAYQRSLNIMEGY